MRQNPFKASAVSGTTVIPTSAGIDLFSIDRKYDAHIRVEKFQGEKQITVDVFDSMEKNADAAHIDSQEFPYTQEGAAEAEDYLRNGIPEFTPKYNFDYRVMIGK